MAMNVTAPVRRVADLLWRHRAEALWCLWFALVIGIPHVSGSVWEQLVASSRSIEGPWWQTNTVAFEAEYGFASLGLLIGLWVASFPVIAERLERARVVRAAVWIVGLMALLLVVIDITDALGPVFEAFRVATFPMGVANIESATSGLLPWYYTLMDARVALGQCHPLLIGVSALACGACGWACLTGPTGAGGAARGSEMTCDDADRVVPYVSGRRLRLVAVLSLVIGLTRAFAWALILPHGPFPLALNNAWHLNDPENAWVHPVAALLWVPVGLMLLVAVCAVVLARHAAWGSAANTEGTVPDAAASGMPGRPDVGVLAGEGMRAGTPLPSIPSRGARAYGSLGTDAAASSFAGADERTELPGRAVLATLVPLCAGELAFRLAGRLFPPALGIDLPVALACLVLHLVALGALVVLAVSAGHAGRLARALAWGSGRRVSHGGDPSAVAYGTEQPGCDTGTEESAKVGEVVVADGAGHGVGEQARGAGEVVCAAVAGDALGTCGVGALACTAEMPARTAGIPVTNPAGLELPAEAQARLVGWGLTDNEMNAVRARVLGLTSRQASQALGIQPSTVRAYGRRACTKAGVATLDDLVAALGIERCQSGQMMDSHVFVAAAGLDSRDLLLGEGLGAEADGEGDAAARLRADAERVGASGDAGHADAARAEEVGPLSADDLPASAAEAPVGGSGTDVHAGRTACDSETKGRRLLARRVALWAARIAGIAGSLAAGLLLLLPYGLVASAWGMVWETAFGAGFGLLLWLVGVRFALRRLSQAHVLVAGSLLVGFVVAAGVLAWCQGRPNALGNVFGGHSGGWVLVVAATAACTTLWLTCLDCALSAWPTSKAPSAASASSGPVADGQSVRATRRHGLRTALATGWPVGMVVVLAGMACVLASIGSDARRVVLAVAVAAMALGLAGVWLLDGVPTLGAGRRTRVGASTGVSADANPVASSAGVRSACAPAGASIDACHAVFAGRAGDGSHPACASRGVGPLARALVRPVGSGLGALTLAVALVAPLAWEELWRGRTWDSLESACIPFVLALGVFGLCWLWALRPRVRLACALATVFACVVAVIEGVLFGLAVGIALLAAVALMTGGFGAPTERAHGTWPWHAPALMLAAGCFLAVYGVNLYGTMLYRQPRGFGLFGGPTGFATFWGVIVGALLLVLAGAWIAALVVRERDARVVRLTPTPSQAQRLRGYLVGRGLRELEIDVVLLLASGASSAQVAVALSYARSTVATARREAYRKLGVHSRDRLIAILNAVLAA